MGPTQRSDAIEAKSVSFAQQQPNTNGHESNVIPSSLGHPPGALTTTDSGRRERPSAWTAGPRVLEPENARNRPEVRQPYLFLGPFRFGSFSFSSRSNAFSSFKFSIARQREIYSPATERARAVARNWPSASSAAGQIRCPSKEWSVLGLSRAIFSPMLSS